MKKLLFSFPLLIFFCFCGCNSSNQTKNEKIETGESNLYINENSTNVNSDINGGLIINLNRQDLDRFKKKGIINYSDFGAIGDGISDDAVLLELPMKLLTTMDLM